MTTSNNDILLGNILHNFPELLIQVLPYIADRTVFNAIASCNRDINEKSKAIVPPWPNHYRLPASGRGSIAVWSPDGTRVAYTDRHVITIVDQRHGIIHRINNNGPIVSELKFSPDGRFLVSADNDGIISLWDNFTGNDEPPTLQMLNIPEEEFPGVWNQDCSFDISACSKYIVMDSSAVMSNRVIVKSVENGATVGFLTPQHIPSMLTILGVMFSVDYRAVFVWGQIGYTSVIKLWRPFLDDGDEDSVITLWKQGNCDTIATVFSHDKTMIASQNAFSNKGWVVSTDNNNNYSGSTQEFNFEDRNNEPLLLQFTPDDKYIVYATTVGLKYWSVVERKSIDNNNRYLLYTVHGLTVVNCSPNNRQLIVRDDNKEGDSLYLKSIF